MATSYEKWRFGNITEDKKLPVRFLDSDGDPISISTLYGYGVKVFSNSQTVILCGHNIDGYSEDCLIPVSDTEIKVAMEGTLLDPIPQYVWAMTTVIIADADMPDGYFTDHSDTVPIIYQAVRENG